MAPRRRRIAICDDSKPFGEALTKLLEQGGDLEVIGCFATGEELIAGLKDRDVDLVTMDLEIPGMGGLRTIKSIMRDRPLPILVISSHSDEHSKVATEALGAGALEAIHKRTIRFDSPDGNWAKALRSRIRLLSNLHLDRRLDRPAAPRAFPASSSDSPAGAVVIGASAGGPPALMTVLGVLPSDYPVPVLIVQHIAKGFLAGLVDWLAEHLSLPVSIAKEGGRATPGITFAPEDAHLSLGPAMYFRLDRDQGLEAHRPSIDVLFTSAAAVLRKTAVGVVLTGMGHDGAHGVEAIRSAGGRVVAQDKQTSAVYGMPLAAAKGGADLVKPLEEIGPILNKLRPAAASA